VEHLKWGLKDIPVQIDYNEVITTFMQTKVEYKMQQMPLMNYVKEVHWGQTDIDMLWIASLPLTELGGYIFVWDDDAKESTCIHVPYGCLLLLQDDVIHGGGFPEQCTLIGQTLKWLHMYLPVQKGDVGLGQIDYVVDKT